MPKVCAVFGGSGGIGRSISRKFYESGVSVAVLSRSCDRVAASVQELASANAGGEFKQKIRGYTCDVVQEKSVVGAVSQVLGDFGQLDILVNAAGVNNDSLLVRAQYNDITEQVKTNLIGPMLTCRATLKAMLSKRTGSIINIGSIVGSKGNPGQCVYSASKSGLVGFTKSLAKEVGARGIQVNMLVPGFINTEMTEQVKLQNIEKLILLQRMGRADEIAEAALFLSNASYITGQILYVDGGLHISS